ncbi:MAG: hypothetical protein AAGK47_10460, partial [Bacteroidota bacterium]
MTQQYKIGHILQHPTTLAVGHAFGGLSTDTRYVIASAHTEMTTPERGLIAAAAFFKVLDIMVINQKTQILLLHLPETAVEVFTTQHIPFEDKLLETHRQIFITHTYEPPAVQHAALEVTDANGKLIK